MKQKKKIVYIIGLGRSGTTLLDVVLGNQEEIFSCGELNRYAFEEGVPYQFPKRHASEIFWLKIKKIMGEYYSSYDYAEMKRLSGIYDYHAGFLINFLGLNRKTKGFNDLKEFNSKLYNVIFENAESTILVDSSKYSNRALFLSNFNTFDIVYIYIKRDPVQVVRSFGKKNVEQGSRSFLSANYYCFFASLLCHLAIWKLKRSGSKVSIVKHTDLINNPLSTLDAISGQLQLNLNNVKNSYQKEGVFKVGTLFYGNRVRLLKEIALRSENPQNYSLKDRITRIVNYCWYR